MNGFAAVVAIVIFSVLFFLIATERVHRVAVVLGAAGLMVALRLVPGDDVFFDERAGIDWGVIFLLLGMMIIVGVIKQTGVFEFLGIWAGKRSRGQPYRLLVLLMVITAVASPFLDNVTTVMLVAPVTIVVCQKLGLAAAPYLIAEALASNIGGAATLIGDPPNIIIGARAGLTFNDFIVHMTPIVVVLFALFVVMARFMFRKAFVHDPDRAAAVMNLNGRAAIKDKALLVRCLVVLGLVTVAFSLHHIMHLEPAIIALLGAGLMVLVSGAKAALPRRGRVVYAGVLHGPVRDGRRPGRDRRHPPAGHLGGRHVRRRLLRRGDRVDLRLRGARRVLRQHPVCRHDGAGRRGHGGAGVRPRGGRAAVVGLRARRRPGRQRYGGRGERERGRARHRRAARAPISFWQFTKYGIVTTVVTVVVAWGYVWLRYFS